ncbi:hypothetical protein D6856_02545 [Butyrivibrio sp. XB500-5]|uniref:hypothetical protein n=1 Tax=Butyrivibrio sp. XB500-5 TaxID=2364880 RepID=UPI000EA8E0CB|nr:hypothetical protein [Butyrivibrio sp. XB500-5]RKM63020.1 hypothetical protein D6856_02545 [Butyrivibrio sp. XB500-5]
MGKRKTPEEIPLMKSELVAEAFTILMEAYTKMIGRCASGQKMTITMKSYNRYIRFSGFREYFDICLYKSGDIDIKMDEYCHDKYVERIFEFTENRSEQNAFLDKLRNGLAEEIMEVATCKLVDYHSFMDMLHGEWKFTDAHNYFKNEIMG